MGPSIEINGSRELCIFTAVFTSLLAGIFFFNWVAYTLSWLIELCERPTKIAPEPVAVEVFSLRQKIPFMHFTVNFWPHSNEKQVKFRLGGHDPQPVLDTILRHSLP